QVNGIAISNPEVVILQSQARQAAYQQIGQTYQSQIQQVSTLRQETNALEQSLDTNSDGQLTEAEVQANPAVVQQINQKEQQIGQLYQPIALAQTYAIEQLVNDYENAQNQVMQQKGIQMLLSPDAVQSAPDSANVTGDIVAALNSRMPSVQTTPPQGWQPNRQSVALQQRIQQILLGLAQQQAMAQAQQQQAGQPQAPAQPTGR
ncbi:MAG: OmpH family outer membrane protein, partial [Citromicrobium sp.]|nr:OmpH family outer membrane protein [Citromicrobium sp.]